ncbi:MAG TPA: hypothetical protein DDY14_15710 [Chromatiaceae bacterium]|nr:MAG: hypothetical protein N838_18950 [Thiohalocapsa sp. PB-PSB1]QQO52124.1 MAG: hypothetical protein N838_00775 [Thiohalocapsa sp. PB-PSB1]HBG96728.1 hypothetical protein [Chromatiaceae bacterium]HCS92607.1 hypothetical protein [Chromatiaceae bacterium]
MTTGTHAFAACLLVTFLVAGCGGAPTSGAAGGDDPLGRPLEHTAVASDWNSIAVTKIACGARTEHCAKAHATKGDACLRLAIKLPQSASAKDSRTRDLLDCAEQGYRKALQKQPSKTEPSRISYHGGLLLTLSERRNRLDDAVKDKKLDRENEKLLMAAQDARREVPGSALGFLYGASAYVYRATLHPRGRARCNDLRQAVAMMQRSPPPPRELAAEQARIRSLAQRQLRQNQCPPIKRR